MNTLEPKTAAAWSLSDREITVECMAFGGCYHAYPRKDSGRGQNDALW